MVQQWKYYKNKTDHSSKYGLNPEQFEIDMHDNELKYKEKKERFNNTLIELIQSDFKHEENFSLILDCLRQMRLDEKY